MFCPKCGTQNDIETDFCSKCKYDFLQIPQEMRVFKENIEEKLEDEKEIKDRERTEGTVGDYFSYAILVAVLCSLVFGAAALVFSGLTKIEKENKDIEKAKFYSEKAKMFCRIAAMIGVIKYIYVLVFLLIMIF